MKLFFNRPWPARELRRLARENQGKPLSILDDVVFKTMLSADNNEAREALRSLLSACIHREVVGVKVLNNELLPAHLAAKTARLDVHVTFNDGEVADLEMQIGQSDDDLKARATAYTAMIQAGQVRRGKQYSETKRVYQIFFLNCVLFKGSDKVPRRYGYREEKEGDLLTNTVEIIFYEMPKLKQRVQDFLAGKTGTETLQDDEKWCIYMKYRHEEQAKPLIQELCQREAGIMQAEKSLGKVSRSYQKYIREMNIAKNEMERWYKNKAAREAGQTEKALEIARKMKDKGLSVAEIIDITGLSMEAVEKL
ncbi:MAG: Rpn family recombination-promoting nuclease/putative transposase [Treponema sp.]|nr:Rpn family recombination-promoting nuclease/putative transposase [Treponema sp.]